MRDPPHPCHSLPLRPSVRLRKLTVLAVCSFYTQAGSTTYTSNQRATRKNCLVARHTDRTLRGTSAPAQTRNSRVQVLRLFVKRCAAFGRPLHFHSFYERSKQFTHIVDFSISHPLILFVSTIPFQRKMSCALKNKQFPSRTAVPRISPCVWTSFDVHAVVHPCTNTFCSLHLYGLEN
jgi:hypothetical protein